MHRNLAVAKAKDMKVIILQAAENEKIISHKKMMILLIKSQNQLLIETLNRNDQS